MRRLSQKRSQRGTAAWRGGGAITLNVKQSVGRCVGSDLLLVQTGAPPCMCTAGMRCRSLPSGCTAVLPWCTAAADGELHASRVIRKRHPMCICIPCKV